MWHSPYSSIYIVINIAWTKLKIRDQITYRLALLQKYDKKYLLPRYVCGRFVSNITNNTDLEIQHGPSFELVYETERGIRGREDVCSPGTIVKKSGYLLTTDAP